MTPRCVPIPLLPKVKEELQRMENMGVITKIDEPTEWCAGMVVVPKQSGKVRICVDLTKLNESVCREGAAHTPFSRANTGTNKRSQVFYEAGRKLWLLADRIGPKICHAHDIHYAIRKVLL